MISSNGRLAGKAVIVTGAGSGLGQATALMSAEAGARIVCADISREAAETTASRIRTAGGEALSCQVDITSMEAAGEMAGAALKAFGRIDVLANFAGVSGNGSATTVEPSVWHSVLATNLTGAWHVSRAVLPAMIEQGSGSIILVASIAAITGVPATAPYAASKAGVVGLTRQMAIDYAQNGIRANVICPGTVPTPLVLRHYLARGEIDAADVEAGLQSTHRRFPMRRHGRPEEIAGLALYLASDESAFMTGAVLPIDGGVSAAGWQVGD